MTPFSTTLLALKPLAARLLLGLSMMLMAVFTLLAPAPAAADALIGSVSFTESSYQIGAGDVLAFHVYHQDDLNQGNILVRSDGMASFHSMGELMVRGRSIGDVQKLLEEHLSVLVKKPIVTVTVTQTKPGTIYLSGAVKRPGMYQLSTGNQNSATGPTNSGPISRIDLRLSNILANAGGIKLSADLSQVQIKRQSPAGEMMMSVNLWKMLKHGDSSQDVMLQSGDAIHIPPLPKMAMSDEDYDLVLNSSIGPATFPVRVLGELKKPGVYHVPGSSPYLNSAVALAEGYTAGANKKMIAIRRFTTTNDVTTLYVDPQKLDIVLRPNDIVYVSPQKIYKTGKFFENVSKILSPFTNAAFSAGQLRP